ncbi:MAG: GNAT family N-acetyltransferase [Bacteroidota bacterium]|nr:GNAT family N-acetyltransferase [Bacteroidota bacterium]
MRELNLTPFPILETDRLVLRQISIDDAEDILRLRSNDEAIKYIHKPKLTSIDDAIELIKIMNSPDRIQWGIALKNENKIIGTIGYHRIIKEHYRAEIGYMLHPQYWNNGLMNESIKKIIDFGFDEMKLHSIEAIINPENNISRKILQKFNFINEAYFKENFFFEGKFFDSEVYSLVKNDCS